MRHTSASNLAALLLAALLLCRVGVSGAETASPQRLLSRGNELFATGDYDGAYQVYKEAYESSPRAVFLRSMAFCLLKLYRHAEGQALLKEYVKRFPKAEDSKRFEVTVRELEDIVQTKLVVRTVPPDAEFYIDAESAGKVGQTPYSGTIIPGTHLLIFKRAGYGTTVRKVAIQARTSRSFEISLEIPFAVASIPTGASVSLGRRDAEPIGKTPYEGGIVPGKHTVFVSHPGYAPTSRTFVARPGQAVTIELPLALAIAVTSRPPHARVFVNEGPVLGFTPIELTLLPGSHMITIEKDGFTPFRERIALVPGAAHAVHAELGGGLLTMRTAKPGALVLVDGEALARTPVERYPVPVGQHAVSLKDPDRRTWRRALLFTADERVTADVNLGRRPWPTWALATASAAMLITGAILGGVASSRTADVNEAPVYDNRRRRGEPVGFGYCAGRGRYPLFGGRSDGTNLFTGAGQPLSEATDCSTSLHDSATGVFVGGLVTAASAAAYYYLFARSSDVVTRQPRAESERRRSRLPRADGATGEALQPAPAAPEASPH